VPTKHDAASDSTTQPVPFAQACAFWFRLGLVSFGGPAGQIALMHSELVQRKRWLSEDRFQHALSYCTLLPGPEAQQLATYTGWLLHGVRGGLVAGLSFILPGLLVLWALCILYVKHGASTSVAPVFIALNAAVVAIVLDALLRMARKMRMGTLHSHLYVFLAVTSLICTWLLQTPFPYLVALALLLGFYVQPKGASASVPVALSGALIKRTALLLVVIVALFWVLPWLALRLFDGGAGSANGTLSRLCLLCSKAALITFGGAYAVLPYIAQASVVQYQWLSYAQMMDGLALGETTPGPLVLVISFVGFLAGYQSAIFGPEHLLLSGLVASAIATYFTFLPSFVFVLLGAPLIEKTAEIPSLQTPLRAVQAAVIGVMACLLINLCVHMAYQNQQVQPLPVAAALIAFTLLRWYQLSVFALVVLAALFGLLVAVLK
jgi:chromate transporter